MNDAIEALKAGRAVIFPTDTVYGLGVAVNHAASPRELFELKRRPADKPVAWLIGDVCDLDRYGEDVSDEARGLAARGWPGALTIIVKASSQVQRAYQSAQGTIGLRVPNSDIARRLIGEVGPIAASSANISGEPVPRSFAAIDRTLKAGVAAAIEADKTLSGTASTVIDCTKNPPLRLRG